MVSPSLSGNDGPRKDGCKKGSIATSYFRSLEDGRMSGQRVLQQIPQGHKAGRGLVIRADDCEGGQVWRKIINAFFHHGFQATGSRTAGVAGSVQPELDGAILDTYELHLAIELAKTRSYVVEGFQDPGLEVVGMK